MTQGDVHPVGKLTRIPFIYYGFLLRYQHIYCRTGFIQGCFNFCPFHPFDTGQIQNKGKSIFSYRMYSLYWIWANLKQSKTGFFYERMK